MRILEAQNIRILRIQIQSFYMYNPCTIGYPAADIYHQYSVPVPYGTYSIAWRQDSMVGWACHCVCVTAKQVYSVYITVIESQQKPPSGSNHKYDLL